MAITDNFSGGLLPANYTPNQYSELGNSIGKIAYQIIREVVGQNPLAVFDKMPVNKGDTIEQAVITLVEAQGYDMEGDGALSRDKATKMAVCYFKNWERHKYKQTVDISMLRKILTTNQGTEEIADRLVSVLAQSDIDDKYQTLKRLLAWGAGTGNAFINLGSIAGTAGGEFDYKAILKQIRNTVDGMSFVNSTYNRAGIRRSTRKEDILILAPYSLINSIDVDELAGVFNLSKAEIQSKLIKLDTTDNIVYIVDKNAIWSVTRLYEMMPQINADGLFYNYFLHVERLFAISPLFDGCFFTATTTPPANQVSENTGGAK